MRLWAISRAEAATRSPPNVIESSPLPPPPSPPPRQSRALGIKRSRSSSSIDCSRFRKDSQNATLSMVAVLQWLRRSNDREHLSHLLVVFQRHHLHGIKQHRERICVSMAALVAQIHGSNSAAFSLYIYVESCQIKRIDNKTGHRSRRKTRKE